MSVFKSIRKLRRRTFAKDIIKCIQEVVPIQGNIDALRGNKLLGWIKSNDSQKAVNIDVYLNGKCFVRNYLANFPRLDVRSAGYGDGCYGFEVPLPKDTGSGWGRFEVYLTGSQARVLAASFEILADNIVRQSVADESCSTLPVLSYTEKPDYRLRIDKITTKYIRGWCADQMNKGHVFELDVLINGILFERIRNDQYRHDVEKAGFSNGLGGFRLDLPFNYMEDGDYTVSIRCPDGTTQSQVLVSVTNSRPIHNTFDKFYSKRTSIVVPIYNAAEDVIVCIDRLAAFTPETVDIFLIDDCSTDKRISKILKESAKYSNIHVLYNSKNLGFTKTVNKGVDEVAPDNVIILNSDARVTPGWFDGMIQAAASGEKIATVTPMSDRAGAFSAPDIGNENDLPLGIDEISYSKAFRRRGLGVYPEVPTGNGFCMFIRRTCLEEIGGFDVDAFPRGYGEENDFCMRAVRAGWRNIIDDRTYVYHDRSKSFGDQKTDLIVRGRAVVDERYPEYNLLISTYRTDLKIRLARFRARQALLDCSNGETILPRVLYVVSTRNGGTPQTNQDLMAALSDSVDTWLLQCDSRTIVLSRFKNGKTVTLQKYHMEDPITPVSHTSFEYDRVVRNWFSVFDFDFLHIRHLAWHSLSLPAIAKTRGIKVVFSFHDYYSLCPTVKLLDNEQEFCGGDCTKSESICTAELWPEGSLPPLKDSWVSIWREKFTKVLSNCDAFVTTSESAKSVILNNMHMLEAKPFDVIPHGRDFERFFRRKEMPVHGEPLRILLPGNIDEAKGLNVVLELLALDTAELLEFHLLGAVNLKENYYHSRIIKHGTYQREDFTEKAVKINAHVGAVFSIWNETYCHTLTELWSIGLPVIVFDFETVASRVRSSGCGWVMDHRDLNALYQEIIRVCYSLEEQKEKENALLDWQNGLGICNTTKVMAAKYLDVYRSVWRSDKNVEGNTSVDLKTPHIAVICPADKNLREANASTHVRIWERTRNSLERDITYIRLTPLGLLGALNSHEIDGAIIQRTAIPISLWPLISDAFLQADIPYLLDLDDNLLNVPVDKDPDGSYAGYLRTLCEIIMQATTLSVSTPQLVSAFEGLNSNIILLPNVLSERLWSGILPERQDDSRVRCLYMGTKTHQEDFDLTYPALYQIAQSYPNFRLVLVGISSTSNEELPGWVDRLEIPSGFTSYPKFVDWLKSVSGQFDFAVAPLTDTIFNASKSSLKILDYGALGLPVLASDTDVYRKMGTGAPSVELVGNTHSQWVEALESKVEKGKENRVDGHRLRTWVFKNHMLDEVSLSTFDTIIKKMATGVP